MTDRTRRTWSTSTAAYRRCGDFAQNEPAVWVGPGKLDLPRYETAVRARIDAFVVNGVSYDAHVISATAISGIADTSMPFQPIIWNCR